MLRGSPTCTVLRGVFSIIVTDGETRQIHAGDMVLLEDITPCRGHITVWNDVPLGTMDEVSS